MDEEHIPETIDISKTNADEDCLDWLRSLAHLISVAHTRQMQKQVGPELCGEDRNNGGVKRE